MGPFLTSLEVHHPNIALMFFVVFIGIALCVLCFFLLFLILSNSHLFCFRVLKQFQMFVVDLRNINFLTVKAYTENLNIFAQVIDIKVKYIFAQVINISFLSSLNKLSYEFSVNYRTLF